MTIDQKQATNFLSKLEGLIRENEEAKHLLVRDSYARVLVLARRSLNRRIGNGEFPVPSKNRSATCTQSTASSTRTPAETTSA